MTIFGFVLLIGGIYIVALVAYWLVIKFAPLPARPWVLGFAGLLLLAGLLVARFPGALNTRIW